MESCPNYGWETIDGFVSSLDSNGVSKEARLVVATRKLVIEVVPSLEG